MEVIAHHIHRFYPHTRGRVLLKEEDPWVTLSLVPTTDVVNLK